MLPHSFPFFNRVLSSVRSAFAASSRSQSQKQCVQVCQHASIVSHPVYLMSIRPLPPSFFRFGRGGRARMSARGNRFRRSRPVRSGRFCGKKSAICRMKRGLEAHLRKLRNSSVQKLQKAKAEIDHCNKKSRNANFFQKIY